MHLLAIASVIGRTTGTFSCIGSLLIIYMILSEWERKIGRTYQRIMLLMSIFDVIQSVAFVISVTALPRQYDDDDGVFGEAKGNAHTCTAQGFFMTLGLAVPLCNLSLNIFYVLTIRYNYSVNDFAKIGPFFYATSILIPLSIAIFVTVKGDMEPRYLVCYPHGRLARSLILILIFTCFFVCIVSMILVSITAMAQSQIMERYTYPNRRDSTRSMNNVQEDKRLIIKQALFYAVAFIATYTFPTIQAFYKMGMPGVEGSPAFVILTAVFYPLQGLWNFMFYVRAAFRKAMQDQPEMSYVHVFIKVVFKKEILRKNHDRQQNTTSNQNTSPHSCIPHCAADAPIICASNDTSEDCNEPPIFASRDNSEFCDVEEISENHSNDITPPNSSRRPSLLMIKSIINDEQLSEDDTNEKNHDILEEKSAY